MQAIYKKMKKSVFALRIVVGIILMFAGLLIFLAAESENIEFLTASRDLYDMPDLALREENFYKCKTNTLIDCYAEDEEGLYYISPIKTYDDETTYMGFYVYNKDVKKADAVVEATWEAMQNGTKSNIYLSGHGYIYYMSGQEVQFFEEYFEEAGFTEEEISDLCRKTFVLVPISKMFTFRTIFGAIISLSLIIIGLVLIVGYITGSYTKKFKQKMKQANISETDLAYDIENGIHLKFADIGRKYIVLYGASPNLIVCDDLIWAYVHVLRTRHMLYGVIPTGTTKTSSLIFISNDKSKIQFGVRSEKIAQEILEKVAMAAPHAIIGFDEQLQWQYTQNPDQFIQMIEVRKNQY